MDIYTIESYLKELYCYIRLLNAYFMLNHIKQGEKVSQKWHLSYYIKNNEFKYVL